MARTVLEKELPPGWIDDVFETHRRYKYARDLLFFTVVGLMTFVVLGTAPFAARRSDNLPVSLTALCDKFNRTEPDILRAFVRASATRLAPAMAGLG